MLKCWLCLYDPYSLEILAEVGKNEASVACQAPRCRCQVVFRTTTPSGELNMDNPAFFFGGEQGIIYLADDFGLCSERYKIGSPLLLLAPCQRKKNDMTWTLKLPIPVAQWIPPLFRAFFGKGFSLNSTNQKRKPFFAHGH